MERERPFVRFLPLLTAALLLAILFAVSASAQTLQDLKNPETDEGLSSGGSAAIFGPYTGSGNNNPQTGYHDHGRGGNSFVNDPCLDPPAPNRRRTVQSEDEIATFGKYMVVGYNDSFGFYDNTQGLSGFSYSVNGGNTWVDAAGLPPLIPAPGVSVFAPGVDGYFGDPVVVVDRSARTFGNTQQDAGQFYYSSIYKLPNGTYSLSVNRGRFQTASPQTTESVADTRCLTILSCKGFLIRRTFPANESFGSVPS